MNLYSQQNPPSFSREEVRWINDVRYLHSLWHQGPFTNANPNHSLGPLFSPSFKRTPKPKPKPKPQPKSNTNTKKRNAIANEDSEFHPPSTSNWPKEDPLPDPPPQSGWAHPKPPPPSRPASTQERAKIAAVQLHQHALKSCRDFFAKDSSDDDDDDDDGDLMVEDIEDSENFRFFLGVFSKDDGLRSYYEKNCEGGEFFCLACGGVGEKIGKRFGNCVALVQHSLSISKTKGKNAHRAFGKVVCRVLAWDFNRLPSIVLDTREPLGRSIDKAMEQDILVEAGSREDAASNQDKSLYILEPVGKVGGEQTGHADK